MLDTVKAIIQYVLPKYYITKIIGWCATCHGGYLTKWMIMIFILWYRVNMKEAQKTNVSDYATFNDFFIRPIRKEVRPIDNDPTVLVYPADGTILQLGTIKHNKLFQAKKYYYNLEELLAYDTSMISYFYDGNFITIYLSPKDYHRVHMPCRGILRKMLHVPGRLFSVNPTIVNNVPNLFSRNERVICLFDTEFGAMVQILIGSIIVGSIETSWGGAILRTKNVTCWNYLTSNPTNAIILSKGQEMGRFKLGSTVINLFMKNNIIFEKYLSAQYITKVGKKFAISNI